ncbi:hypothetical protein [Paenibacillus naphthalenovorans]|uniref:Uncharacterized protein n=1 Tax=Paenibacillus naphthalenovorans TaxID=162209 RepID=A0A0U2VNA9_9BACL|nr:hypothetical protein [Paenibacillus naphthalenovorans]ALS22214.1 hypothetical protein IJ22_18400 [Paenibacillus naphthalenovorans]
MRQVELNKAARKIAKANTALWEAIGLINEALSDETITKVLEASNDEDMTSIEKLALAYEKINKKYDGFINASMHGRDLDEFDELTSRISEIIEG